ncbi:MAG: class I SAM-dependent methyltransferase [Nitrospirota bacterium]
MKGKIKEYWEERAKQHLSPEATTSDVYQRELEISTIIKTLQQITVPENRQVLDVGCGDGYSTLKVAQAISNSHFLGIDYSENMIKNACERLESQPELKDRVTFIVGNVMDIGQVCGDAVYDIILSVRCLINLDSFESQSHAIAQISGHAKPGGYYIAIENFIEGHENMNRARRAVSLPEIPVRWHNLYFKEREFVRSVERFFEDITFKDFSSSYYFATRVIYSAMCQMRKEEPDYNHEVHRLAIHLPWIGQFSPIRMAVLRKKLR